MYLVKKSILKKSPIDLFFFIKNVQQSVPNNMILFAVVMGLPTQMDVIWKLQNALKIRICKSHLRENVQAKVS